MLVSFSDCKQAIITGYKLKFRKGYLIKHPGISKNLSQICWFQMLYIGGQGLGNNQSIADCISDCRKAINIEEKVAEQVSLGLVPTQLHATRKLHAFICTPLK